MNTFDPQLAAEQAREAYRKTIAQFEPLALEAAVPESVRSLPKRLSRRRGRCMSAQRMLSRPAWTLSKERSTRQAGRYGA